ncbi:hypothetical protein, partial [Helicobacter sp. 13S00477-4]|uniref:hypothetical protein n=1 Tax=Helicobacter sp. 13S00477-4 TaxID=1905759 RepID=UPI00117B5CB0
MGGGASLKADSISAGSSVSTTQPIQSFNINLQTALSFSKDKAKSGIEEQFKILNENKAEVEKSIDTLNKKLVSEKNNIKENIIEASNSIHAAFIEAYFSNNEIKNLRTLLNDLKNLVNNSSLITYTELKNSYLPNMINNLDKIEETFSNIQSYSNPTITTYIKNNLDNLSEINNNIQTNQTNLQAIENKIAQITTLAKIQQKAISTIHSEQKTLSSLSNATYNNLSALNFS